MLKRYLIFAMLIFFCLSYSALLLPDAQLFDITKEDHFIEYFQVVCLSIAAILFVLKYRSGSSRKAFFLIIALGIFFVIGEEISWGQRIFHVQTPEIWARNNVQGETNIHNLKLFMHNPVFNESRMVSKIFVFYFLLLPLLSKFNKRFSRFVQKINLPMVPVSLGCFSLVIIIMFKLLPWQQNEYFDQAFKQLKETQIYFFIMIIAFWFLFGGSREKGHHSTAAFDRKK